MKKINIKKSAVAFAIGLACTSIIGVTLVNQAEAGAYSDRPSYNDIKNAAYDEFSEAFDKAALEGKAGFVFAEDNKPFDVNLYAGSTTSEVSGTVTNQDFAGRFGLGLAGVDESTFAPEVLDATRVEVQITYRNETRTFTGSLRDFAINNAIKDAMVNRDDAWVIDAHETVDYLISFTSAETPPVGLTAQTINLQLESTIAAGY